MKIREHIGRALTRMAFTVGILLAATACSYSGFSVEPAGAPSSTQDNDGGGY